MAVPFFVLELLKLQEELQNREVANRRVLMRRQLRDATDPFSIDDAEFVRLFRLSKPVALEVCDKLDAGLRPTRRHGLPVHLQVLITLRFLRLGSYQGGLCQDMMLNVSQPTVSRVVRKVTELMMKEFCQEEIQFPATKAEREAAERSFRAVAGFPGIVGCVDCIHIAIIAPHRDPEMYVNRHRFHSLNVQIICSEDLKITSINAKHPGTTHDQVIWENCDAKEELDSLHTGTENRGNYFVLGDSMYTCDRIILTPVKQPVEGTKEWKYNVRHKKVMSRIDGVIKKLQETWGCLQKERVLHYDPVQCGHIIHCCAALYNVLLRTSDRVQHVQLKMEEEENELINMELPTDLGKKYLRQNIINTYF